MGQQPVQRRMNSRARWKNNKSIRLCFLINIIEENLSQIVRTMSSIAMEHLQILRLLIHEIGIKNCNFEKFAHVGFLKFLSNNTKNKGWSVHFCF